MADNNLTIFQRLNNVWRAARGSWTSPVVNMAQTPTNRVIFSTNDRDAYEKKLSTLKQEKYLLNSCFFTNFAMFIS